MLVRCGLFNICESPSKCYRGWACTQPHQIRKHMCAVFVAFHKGKNVQDVLDLTAQDIVVSLVKTKEA